MRCRPTGTERAARAAGWAAILVLLAATAGADAPREARPGPLATPPTEDAPSPGLVPATPRPGDAPLPGLEVPGLPDRPDVEDAIAPPPAPPEPTEELTPEVIALLREGMLEMRAENHEGAVAALRRAHELAPRDRRIRFGLGTALIAVNAFEEAVEILEGLARDAPHDYAVLNNLGWLYATAADPAIRDGRRALSYARRALLLAPGDYHVWSTLSEAYYVAGQYREALRAAEEALRISRRAGVAAELRRDYEARIRRARHAVQAFEILD